VVRKMSADTGGFGLWGGNLPRLDGESHSMSRETRRRVIRYGVVLRRPP
jgi:hypothetical protein